MTIDERLDKLMAEHWDFSLIRPEPLKEIRETIKRAMTATAEAEREASANVAQQIKEKELRRLDLETCCSNTAAEIEECIRARSEKSEGENHA